MTAVQRGLGIKVRWHPLRRHVQRVKEPADRVCRIHHRAVRAEPAQVDVQLAVGKPVGHVVRVVDGEGGLADAGRPADRRDQHGLRGESTIKQAVQFRQFAAAPAEMAQRGRKLPRHAMPGAAR
jgi:hypothetical protein